MSQAAPVQLTSDEYAALLADSRRYHALRAACLRRASHRHNQWLEILLQIPLGDPAFQATDVDIDFAVDQAFGLASICGHPPELAALAKVGESVCRNGQI